MEILAIKSISFNKKLDLAIDINKIITLIFLSLDIIRERMNYKDILNSENNKIFLQKQINKSINSINHLTYSEIILISINLRKIVLNNKKINQRNLNSNMKNLKILISKKHKRNRITIIQSLWRQINILNKI